MNKDKVEGTAKQAKGAVKEAAGKAVGNERLQAEGKVDKVEGKAQKGLGKVKDAVRKH